jgi:hypothetical protein
LSTPKENLMNASTTATRLTQTVMIAATLAACFMARAADTAVATAMPVLQFPLVTVVGQRNAPAIVQMPRVVVTGHRVDATPVMAKKDEAPSKARPA